MINTPFVEIDVHGLTVEIAVATVQKKVEEAGPGVYKIKVIHGYNRGTAIRDAIMDEYRYGYEPRVKRVSPGENRGITELILREM